MQTIVEHACPRCYQALAVASKRDAARQRVTLACSEPYCDYVLVLSERESVEWAPRWSVPILDRWLVRAAG